MADYTTCDNVRALIGTDVTKYDDDAVEPLITAADSLIDGFLRVRYEVPLTGTIDGNVERIAAKLACCDLIMLMYQYKVPEGMEDTRKNLAKEAMDLLKTIADGKMTIAHATRDVIFTGIGGSFTPLNEYGAYQGRIPDEAYKNGETEDD